MRKIIIDTDPGIDDAAAIAIAMFSPELDVQLITTVSARIRVSANMVIASAFLISSRRCVSDTFIPFRSFACQDILRNIPASVSLCIPQMPRAR